MGGKKVLVVYYSVGGNTKAVAGALAAELGGELVRIEDHVKRTGLFGFMRTGFQGLRKKSVPIDPVAVDAGAYDLVLLGTPVYGGGIAPGLRQFINDNRDKLTAVGYFATGGDPKKEAILDELEAATGIAPAGRLYLGSRLVKDGSFAGRVKEFAAGLRRR
jgi:flavodoxin